MNSAVIGAGLAGLVAGFLTDSVVIGEVLGGQVSESYDLGPRILDYTPQTRKFLEILYKISGDKVPPARKFKVGYFNYGDHKPSTHCSQNDRESYYYKTRGSTKVSSSSMSSGKKVISGWDMGEIDLVSRLIEVSIILKKKINYLDTDQLYVENLRFDRVISTIPLPVLSSLDLNTGSSLIGLECESDDTYYYRASFTDKQARKEFDKFDYVYIPDNSIAAHRMTKTRNNEWVVESHQGPQKVEGVKAVNYISTGDGRGLIRYGFEDPIVLKSSRLKNELKLNYLNHVELAGRYAQWDHSVKLSTIVSRYLNGYLETH